MMFRAIRRTRLAPLFIALALLATMPASMTSLLHNDDDDGICGRALVIHDHGAHHVGGSIPSSVPDPQHCFICHSSTFFAIHSTTRWCAPTSPAHLLALSSDGLASVVTAEGRAARAPPLA